MTDEERLEEIKNNDISYLLYGTKLKDYWEWLIEQAERVQDLKIMLKVLGERNQCYREALETIEMVTEFKSEANEIANKALEGDAKE